MMEIFKNVYKSFTEYYESDEITDGIIKRDYFNSTAFSGIYPIMKKNYRLWSVLLVTIHISIALFHLEVIIRSAIVLYSLNFTLLTFLVQIYLLIQYCILIVITLNTKRKAFRILHKEMMGDFFHYGEDTTETLDALNKDMWKEKKQLLSLPLMLAIAGGNAVILGPIIDGSYGSLGFDITKTTLYMDTPIAANYPFSTSHPSLFYILSLLQGLTMLFVTTTIGSGALLFINVIQYFTLHQKYLLAMITSIESRADLLYKKTYGNVLRKESIDISKDKKYQTCFESCIKKCFCHHQLLLRWFDSLNDLLSLPLGISYATGTVVIALSLLSLKTGTSLPGTAITSFMTCFLEVCFMALISVLGQRVADLNEDLRMAMYNINWYSSSNSVKSSIQIFQEMSLRPMQLTGFGLVKANLDTFSNVMNSAYSYYNLIMAV